MKLSFKVETLSESRIVNVGISSLVVAGWAGRDQHAIEHHIEELFAIGVPRPSSVPLYYRVAENQLTQASRIQVVGDQSSGEVETFVFRADGELYVSIASDHTDRKLETHSVALSKQVCAKPVAARHGSMLTLQNIGMNLLSDPTFRRMANGFSIRRARLPHSARRLS
jgi:hypothetical protein